MSEWIKVEKSASSTWDYKQQPVITGIYKGVQYHVGPNNSTLFKLACDSGEVAVWGSSALDDRMLAIPVGHEVQITYNGLKANKAGTRKYHDFEVVHRELFTEE